MHHIHLLKKRWKALVLGGLFVSALVFFGSFVFPLQYRAEAQVLVISKSRYGVDPYTIVKSAERVGENMREIIHTSDFFQKVREQPGHTIDWSVFDAKTERKKRKAWKKNVNPSVVFGTGVMNITVYDKSSTQASELAGAVVDTLASKGWEYVGGDVTFKVVNTPVVTKYPARPNLFLNAVFGFILGVLLSGMMLVRR